MKRTPVPPDAPMTPPFEVAFFIGETRLTSPLAISLHRVLVSLIGGIAATPDSLDDVRASLARWKNVAVPGHREDQEIEGFYTTLSMTQEFRCVVAALYGRA